MELRRRAFSRRPLLPVGIWVLDIGELSPTSSYEVIDISPGHWVYGSCGLNLRRGRGFWENLSLTPSTETTSQSSSLPSMLPPLPRFTEGEEKGRIHSSHIISLASLIFLGWKNSPFLRELREPIGMVLLEALVHLVSPLKTQVFLFLHKSAFSAKLGPSRG